MHAADGHISLLLDSMSKRKLEYSDYSRVEDEAVSADLHGVGNQYYDCESNPAVCSFFTSTKEAAG